MTWYEKLDKSSVVLIIANLVTIYGVLFLDWEVFPLLMLFWVENLIIGFFNVLKIVTSDPENPSNWAIKLFLAPFFTVHYGLFCFVHGVFLVVLFGQKSGVAMEEPGLSTFWKIIQNNALFIGIAILFASHGFSFVSNYLLKGEYKEKSAHELMFQPYARIAVLHVLIILGGFMVIALGLDLAGLIVLIALKIAADLRAHSKEHSEN